MRADWAENQRFRRPSRGAFSSRRGSLYAAPERHPTRQQQRIEYARTPARPRWQLTRPNCVRQRARFKKTVVTMFFVVCSLECPPGA